MTWKILVKRSIKTVRYTTYLYQWPKSRTLKAPYAHSLLVGMKNCTATLEDSFVVSYKTKPTLTILSSNHTPWYLPKGDENL